MVTTYHPEMMANGIKRGEIYYISRSVSNPPVGSEQIPGRPGVIVSNDTFNRASSTVQVVYLTTRIKAELESHVDIESAAKPSTALCEQLYTVDKGRVGSYVGKCTDEEMEGIDKAIIYALGLPVHGAEDTDDDDDEYSDADVVAEMTRLRVERDTYKAVYSDLLKSFTAVATPSAVGAVGHR